MRSLRRQDNGIVMADLHISDSYEPQDALLLQYYEAEPPFVEKAEERAFSRICELLDRLLTYLALPAEERETLRGMVRNKILDRLRQGRTAEEARIRNPLAYLRIVIKTMSIDLLRPNTPYRRMHQNILRCVNSAHAGGRFASWKSSSLLWIGLSRWQSPREFNSTAQYQAFCEDHRSFSRQALKHHNPDEFSLPDLLEALLDWVDTPLQAVALTHHLIELLPESPWKSKETLSLQDPIHGDLLLEAGLSQSAPSDASQYDWELCWQIISELAQTFPDDIAAVLLALPPEALELLVGTPHWRVEIARVLGVLGGEGPPWGGTGDFSDTRFLAEDQILQFLEEKMSIKISVGYLQVKRNRMKKKIVAALKGHPEFAG